MKVFIRLLLYSLLLFQSRIFAANSLPGQVIGWGENTVGQATGLPSRIPNNISTGTVNLSTQPLRDAVAVSASFFHSLALKSDGTVAGWGFNHKGQTIGSLTSDLYSTNGLVTIGGQVLSNIIEIATGNFSIGLRGDGTLAAWGENKIPDGLSNVVAIAACEFNTLVLKKDGTVVNWRSFGDSQSLFVEGLTNAIAIAVGGQGNVSRMVALRSDGTVTNWGTESIFKDMTPPVGLSNVTAIATGIDHTLALRKDGIVIGWGFNEDGQSTGVPMQEEPYVTNGFVTLNKQVLTNVTAIAANGKYSLALRRDGTVVGWGRSCPKIPADLRGVVAISAGFGYCLAITTNNLVADHFRRIK